MFMRNVLFLLCLVVILPIQLYAQISTVIAEKYTHWMVVKAMRCQFMSHGATGSARTWDFSGLTPVNANDTTRIQYIPRNPAMPFANASAVMKDGNDYTFYEYMADGVYELGSLDSSSNPPDTITYTNSKRIMRHPFTYNQGYTDSFALSGGADSGVGVIHDTVESFGKLILPGDTFENVIRMRITEVIDGTVGGNPVTIRTVSYRWYDLAHRAPLVRLDSLDIGGSKSQEAYYLLSEDPVLISDLSITSLDVTASFAGNKLLLTGGTYAGHDYWLSLYNIAGQEIYRSEFKGGGRQLFDPGKELNTGLYILTVIDKNEQGTAGITKLVKQ